MSTRSLSLPRQPQAALLAPAGKLFIPSVSDVLFFCIIAWSFLAGENGWARLLMDGSAGIHIRIGDYILAQHQVPTHDIFSFALPGHTWYAFEWLSEVVFGSVHAAWGLKGVVLLAGLVLAGTLTVLFRWMLARGVNCWIALVMTLVVTNAMNVEFHSRPHIFTFAFLAVTAWLVDNDRRRPGQAIWALVPLTIVWTNLHGGFFILFPFLGIVAAGSLVEAWLRPVFRKERIAAAQRYLGLLAACALASLINPYGIGLHRHILYTVTDSWVATFVAEFKSPSFRSETLLAYMAMLFVGLGICGVLLVRRRAVEPLLLLFFAYCSLTAVRYVPLFLIVATPIIAMELSVWWANYVASRPKSSAARILDDLGAGFAVNGRRTSIWLPAGMLALCTAGLAWPADFPDELFPTHLIARHADFIAGSRIYTSDQWADYLIYKNFPRQRVFMDDRHTYYGAAIGNDYLALDGGARNWKQILAKYNMNAALLKRDAPLASLLREQPDWRLVEENKLAVLFALREK